MTKQLNDSILIRGVEHCMLSQPLYGYLRACAPALKLKVYASCNWRGYVAAWTIQDDCLYLIRFSGDSESGEPVTVKGLFPFSEGPVAAVWCNETLTLAIEELESSNPSGHGNKREFLREVQITFEAGKVKNSAQH